MTKAFVCPRCTEAELEAHSSLEGWLHCPGCGLACQSEDMEDLEERRAAEEHDREIQACFWESTRRICSGGGGDDGLSVGPECRLPDDFRWMLVSSERLEPLPYPLRVTKVRCSAAEMHCALDAWLADPPGVEEVEELRGTLKAIRRGSKLSQ